MTALLVNASVMPQPKASAQVKAESNTIVPLDPQHPKAVQVLQGKSHG